MSRNYYYSDEVLFEFASTTLKHLETDLPSFTAFDPDLNKERVDRLKTLLEQSLADSDIVNVTRLQDLTDQVLIEMDKSRKIFKQISYWVIKAFPERRAIQRQFGIGRLRTYSNSQARMVEFMHELADTVATYRQELKTAGAPNALLNGVAQQAKKLMEANQQQEQKKGNRSVETEERISRQNELFEILRAFNTAAELVFDGEPARRELYRTPSGSQTIEEDLVGVL